MVDGVCPHCEDHTLLISIVQDYYRCLNCGGDIEQKVNGKISYMPVMNSKTDDLMNLKGNNEKS